MYTFKTVINSLFEQNIDPSRARVLFVGDSNTHDSPANWSGILTRKVGIKNSKVIQKNGATTEWMRKELLADLSKGNRYDYIFIWGGVNDIYSTGTKTGKNKAVQNIKDMIMMLRKAKNTEGNTPKIVVINMACDRLRDEPLRYAVNEKLADEFYRDVLGLQFAQIIPTREVLKLGKVPCGSLSQKDISIQRKMICRDNLCHLNTTANDVLANYIQKAVF